MKRALLHGFLGDSSVWAGIIEGAAIALPGHRGGEKVRSTWAENLDAVAAAVRGCDLAIGYSLGARVALGLLALGAVPRVIAISVNPGIRDARDVSFADDVAHARFDEPSGAPSERVARRARDAAWAKRFRTEPLADVLDAWEAQPLFATQERVDPDRLAVRRARRLALDPQQIARSLDAMGLAEMPDYHGVVDDRCTLIAGADDTKYVAIAGGLPAAVHVIDHCGHDPLLEQPSALAKVLASIA